METHITKQRVAQAFATALLGAAVVSAAALGGPVNQAEAAQTTTGTASTNATMSTSASKIIASVPTTIAFSVNGDGTMTGPTAASTLIQNDSVFGIHVSKIATTAANGFTLSTDISKATAENSVQVSITPASGTAIQLASTTSGIAPTKAEWDMSYSGNGSSTIALTSSGKASKITKDLSSQVSFATINWTFAPGMSS